MIRASSASRFLYSLDVIRDPRGSLIAIEGGQDVPFDIVRTYYLFGMPAGGARGQHAHRTLEQVAVAVNGSCRILLDDGEQRDDVLLDRPELALRIAPMVWHEMHDFSEDCVLLVLASAHYHEADYIRNRTEFDLLVRQSAP